MDIPIRNTIDVNQGKNNRSKKKGIVFEKPWWENQIAWNP